MKAFLTGLTVAVVAITSVLFPVRAMAVCTDSVLLIPAWYKGMQSATCDFEAVKDAKDNSRIDARKTAIKIGANILQAAMVVAGYVAVFYIFKGGFNYIYSAGSSDGMASAKKTLTNAVIGMIIAILAASIVNFIGGAIK